MDYQIEKMCADGGFEIVCGVDEAGRGPLCGPVCAAAVILPFGAELPGVNDSKKLSEKKREAQFDVITKTALSYSVKMVDSKTIDEINILNATMLCMREAINGLNKKPDIVLIDGNKVPSSGLFERSIVKGDSKSISIAAASILAKVTRDRYMLELDKKYPEYEFKRHKGYGTKLHYEKLREFGPIDEHRRTFLHMEKHNG